MLVMKVFRFTIILATLVSLVSCSSSKSTTNKSTKVEFTVNIRGDFSRISEKNTYVVRSKNEHTIQSLDQFNIDSVNFKTTMLAEIFIGERPSSGYQVIIDAITETNDSIIIKYNVQKPEGIVMTVMTSPFLIIEIPKSNKEVIFSEEY